MKSISRSLSGICSTFKPHGMPNEGTNDLWCIYRSVSTTRGACDYFWEHIKHCKIWQIPRHTCHILLIDTGSAWYLQLTSSRPYLLCRIQAKSGMWEHTVITWWLRRGSSVQSSYANPQKWSQRWHSSQTPVAKYILLWFIIICASSGSSQMQEVAALVLCQTKRTPQELQCRTSMDFNNSGITSCYLVEQSRADSKSSWDCEFCLESWKPLTHHFEQISWNGIRNANKLELMFILSLLKICGHHRQLPNFDKVRSRTLRVPHICKHGGDVAEDITLIGLISASDCLNATGANPTSANKHAAIQNF